MELDEQPIMQWRDMEGVTPVPQLEHVVLKDQQKSREYFTVSPRQRDKIVAFPAVVTVYLQWKQPN